MSEMPCLIFSRIYLPSAYLGVEELNVDGHGLVAAGGVPALGAAQVGQIVTGLGHGPEISAD